MKDNTIVIITGPTATGKTALAIEVAKNFNGEIISSDSMQIYKYLDIGTAKPTIEEQNQVKHHLIDFVEPNSEYSVQQYVADADKLISNLFKQNKLPIIVGGTGLYIKSLIYPYSFCSAPKNEKIRNEFKDILVREGKEYLYNLLKERDFEASTKIHCNDTKRVIRALEINKITGSKKSNLNIEETNLKYNVILIALDIHRELLYDRINLRVDKMFEEGLVDEITNVLAKKEVDFNCQSMQAIGYKEFAKYFNKEISLAELKDLIAKNSRNYAKRQITFIKGFKNVKWFNPLEDKKQILEYIQKEIEF